MTDRVTAAFRAHFGGGFVPLAQQTASEDFSDIPRAFSIPSTYWGIGGVDPEAYDRAKEAGTLNREVPVNHSPMFAPVIQPTLDTGTRALVAVALAWVAA